MEKRKLNYWPAWVFFNEVLKDVQWDKIRILDFGGSWGNLLRDVNSQIVHSKYYCLDVCKECIESSKEEFPDANWVYYNRWNLQYNPKGLIGAPIPFYKKMFDLIIAYSVFTHISMAETLNTVKNVLVNILNDSGKCVLSFYDVSDLNYTLKKYSNLKNEAITELVKESENYHNGFYLIDNLYLSNIYDKVDYSAKKMSLSSYYSIQTITEMFSSFKCEIIKHKNNRQNILIIRNN